MKTRTPISIANKISGGELLDYLDLRLSSAHLCGLADRKTNDIVGSLNPELEKLGELKYHVSDYIYSSIAIKFLDNHMDVPVRIWDGLGFAASTLTKAELLGIRMEAAAHYYAIIADAAYVKSNFSLASKLLENAIGNYLGTINNWETQTNTKWDYSADTLGKTLTALESKFSKMNAKLAFTLRQN